MESQAYIEGIWRGNVKIKRKGWIEAVICLTAFILLHQMAVLPQSTQQIRQRPVEDYEAIWIWHAKSLGKEMNLSNEKTDRLVNSYTNMRLSFHKEIIKVPTEGFNPNELTEQLRNSFKSTLEGFLEAGQVSKSLEILGQIMYFWDSRIHRLISFNLEEEKMYQALKILNAYFVSSTKELQKARATSGRSSTRELSTRLEEDLAQSLSSVLNEEQLLEWKKGYIRRR